MYSGRTSYDEGREMKVKNMGRRLSSWIIATAVLLVSIPASFDMMAYLTHHGAVPDNVRVYDFPLGGHGGGGTVPWGACVPPLTVALEDWACSGTCAT